MLAGYSIPAHIRWVGYFIHIIDGPLGHGYQYQKHLGCQLGFQIIG